MERNEYKENTVFHNKSFPLNVFNINNKDNEIINLHWHDYLEIIYLIDGEASFDIKGEVIEAESGDILFVNKGELHGGYAIKGSRVNSRAIVYHQSLLDENYLQLSTQELIFTRCIKKGDKDYLKVRGYIENLISEMDYKDTGYEKMITNTLGSLVITLIRDKYIKIREIKAQIPQYKDLFDELFRYIAVHYPEKITVKQAAGIVHLSTYHFCRVFKQFTGRTFVNFLKVYRVNEAEKLLRSTNIPIAEIAERTGFGNINYFDQVFKELRQRCPSEYRKNV